jgi:hypothetical protein
LPDAPPRRLTTGSSRRITLGGVTGAVLLLVVMLAARLGGADTEPESPAVQFLEQIAMALDALEGRCIESRRELSRTVLELQQWRLERGEQGSALEILAQIRNSLPPSGEPQRCAELARSVFGS